ncbi:MAG: ParB-like protein [Elusimicrobiota bacterium]
MRDTCKTKNLKPTQFSVGEFEVRSKLRRLLGKKSRRRELIKTHVVPVAISPEGEYYALDHHHFVLAALDAGIKRVRFDVRADFSKRRMSRAAFWKAMRRNGWLYLYDQFGEGPREPLYLQSDMRGLSDDPYRSLAWMVREAGGYGSDADYYTSFPWVNFFRKRRLLRDSERRDLKKVLPEAVRLARSPAARTLPGYLGKK